MSATTYRKCFKCNKNRKYMPSEHGYPTGKEWNVLEDRLVCCWCFARSQPDGEQELRARQAGLRRAKKARSKRQNKYVRPL